MIEGCFVLKLALDLWRHIMIEMHKKKLTEALLNEVTRYTYKRSNELIT